MSSRLLGVLSLLVLLFAVAVPLVADAAAPRMVSVAWQDSVTRAPEEREPARDHEGSDFEVGEIEGLPEDEDDMVPDSLWMPDDDAPVGTAVKIPPGSGDASPDEEDRGAPDSTQVHDACAPGDTAVVIGSEGCAAMPDDESFDACFDMDGDGVPEGFTWEWQSGGDWMKIVVYKKIGDQYRKLFSRGVESLGFAPAAWFLRESPQPKGLFMSRAGGSSGYGLYSLDFKRRKFVPVNREFFFTGIEFLDFDGDGQREIFMEGRGHVRRGGLGLGVYRWNGERYGLWWPDWELDKRLWGFPYPVYGRLADVDGDDRPELVVMLDTEKHTAEKWERDDFEGTRELGIWSLGAGGPKLLAKCTLPPATNLWDPALGTITRGCVSIQAPLRPAPSRPSVSLR